MNTTCLLGKQNVRPFIHKETIYERLIKFSCIFVSLSNFHAPVNVSIISYGQGQIIVQFLSSLQNTVFFAKAGKGKENLDILNNEVFINNNQYLEQRLRQNVRPFTHKKTIHELLKIFCKSLKFSCSDGI